MSLDQVSIFLALLALGALILGTLALAAAVVADPVRRAAQIRPLLIPLAMMVALTATAGSLYYSKIADYPVCELCWYQRICMYPLGALLAVAYLRRDRRGGWYVLPLSAVGLAVSVYHYQLQLFPGQGSSCDVAAPCTFKWVDELGFVTIPFMAGCGFVAITGLAVLSLRWQDDMVRDEMSAAVVDRLDRELL